MKDRIGSVFRLFEPRETITISEWAARFRVFNRRSNAKGGRYDPSFAPYQKEWMDSAEDKTVDRVVLKCASQVGKSEILNNIIGYHMDWKPTSMIGVAPTLDMAEAWSTDRIMPMVRDVPRLAGLIAPEGSRKSGNTLLHKVFPGGALTLAGANSPASLASRPIEVVLLDEVDRYPPTAGAEGDPCLLAIQRADTYRGAVIYFTSTPTIHGVSRIEKEFEDSDKRYWFMPCPKCGTFQTFKLENFVHVKEDKSLGPSAYLRCDNPNCDQAIDETVRLKMIRDPRAEWRPTAEFNGVRGYALNGFYSPFQPRKPYNGRLHYIAARYDTAKRNGRYDMQVFTNSILGEPYKDTAETMDTGSLKARCEDYGPVLPDACLVLTAGCDVQGNRIEVEVVAWGSEYESWSCGYFVLTGMVATREPWTKLESLLQREWRTVSGRVLKIQCACIDSSYQTETVLGFTASRAGSRVFAVRGNNTAGSALLSAVSRNNRRRALVYRVGTDTAKDEIYTRLRLEHPGPGYMHFSSNEECGHNLQFFRGLCSEEPQVVVKAGVAKRKWIRTYPANEPLDCRVYALAAVHILQPDWKQLEKKSGVTPKTTALPESKEGSIKSFVNKGTHRAYRPVRFNAIGGYRPFK